MLTILMTLKGFLKKKKYFMDLGLFCHFIYLFGPQIHSFIRKKPLQISEKANFAEFCGILRTAKSSPPPIGNGTKYFWQYKVRTGKKNWWVFLKRYGKIWWEFLVTKFDHRNLSWAKCLPPPR